MGPSGEVPDWKCGSLEAWKFGSNLSVARGGVTNQRGGKAVPWCLVGMGRLRERLGGGAGEAAGGAVEGEADEVNLLATVTIGFGVTLLLDLGEGLLGRAINLELEDEDALGGLGDQIRTTMGLAVSAVTRKEPSEVSRT